MPYIVHVTSGSFDDYSVDRVLLGDVDPVPLLDAMTARGSGGLWTKFVEAREPYWRDRKSMSSEEFSRKATAAFLVRAAAIQTLQAAGFKEIEVTNVHLGDK